MSERSRLNRAVDKRFQHRFQNNFSLSRTGFAALELDPALVEAVKHPNAGCGIFHALRFEQRFPSFARHYFRFHRTAEQNTEGGCDLLRGYTMRPFQLDDNVAAPGFL